MKRNSTFLIVSAIALLGLVMLGGGVSARSSHAPVPNVKHVQAQATLPPELPTDTPMLTLGQTLTETLDVNNSSRLYEFNGKAGQVIRLDVLPQTPDFFTSVNILGVDLETTLGGTIGEDLVGGSVIVKLPEDGVYVVTVDYADSTIGTPAPGTYQITLSPYTPGSK